MKIKRILIITAIISFFLALGSCMPTDEQSVQESESIIESIFTPESEQESDTAVESEQESDTTVESTPFESDSLEESITESQPESESEEESESEQEFESEQESEEEIEEFLKLETDGRFASLDIQNDISAQTGRMSFITKTRYKGIKRIAFNARTGNVTSWWGIAITTDKNTATLYNVDLAVGYFSTGNQWVTFVYEFSETGCVIYSTQGGYSSKRLTELATVPYSEDGNYYIYFVGPLGETFSKELCIDNFYIELFDGTTYIDTFENYTNTGLFNTDKAVTHVVEEQSSTTLPDTDGTTLYETDDTYYQTDEKIDFTAYAPVTVENWGGSWTSNPNLVTDEQYRYMAEAGFTKSLGLYEGRSGDSGYTSNEKAEKDALAVLQFAEKYGIEYYALNEKFYNFVRPDINIEFFDLTRGADGKFYNVYGVEVSSFNSYRYLKSNWKELYRAKLAEMFGSDTEYIDSIAYGGNFASDEPPLPELIDGEWYYGELEQLYYQISIYNKYISLYGANGGEAYVNLLPYGSVNYDARARYDAMLKYYCEKLGPLLGYISYDHYPLNANPYPYVSSTHLLNLEIVANYCKEYDLELRSFVWAKTTQAGHRAIINSNDLSFQVYANLAFGAKEIPYYTYFNYYAPGENGCNSLIDCQTGERTDAYYWAKEINNKVHAVEDAYLSFDWVGAMCFDAGVQNQQFSLLETALSSHDRLTSIQSNADVLVGVFEDEDGKNSATDGFIVMNYSDPYYSNKGETKNVVLTFDNSTHALVYKDGKQYVAELTNGVLSLYLEAGEGVFVVPFVE